MQKGHFLPEDSMLPICSFLYRQQVLLESYLEFLPRPCGRGYSDWSTFKPAKLGYFFTGTDTKQSGLENVPVTYIETDDDSEILETLVHANKQRTKTNEQIGREYHTLKRIIHERESRQGARSDLTNTSPGTSLSRENEVKPTSKAAEHIGTSITHAHRCATVTEAIDELNVAGKEDDAVKLRETLNTSAKRAYRQVQQMNSVIKPVKTRDCASSSYEWQPEKVEKKIRGFIEKKVLKGCAQEHYRPLAVILHQLAEEIEQKCDVSVLEAGTLPVQEESLPG